MKHLEHKLTTYVYSHCNLCNIQIQHTSEKQLKYLKHTIAIYVQDMQHPDKIFATCNMKTLAAT